MGGEPVNLGLVIGASETASPARQQVGDAAGEDSGIRFLLKAVDPTKEEVGPMPSDPIAVWAAGRPDAQVVAEIWKTL